MSADTYVQNAVHIIFSTKNRDASIPPPLRGRLWEYIHGICRKQQIFCHAVGGTGDHLHLLVQVPADTPLAKVVNIIKSNSSRWMSQHGPKFAWQEGYAAFSVSHSVLPSVIQYIDTQDVHHQRMDFAAEIIALLQKHDVSYDPGRVAG
jgi:REP element-mobilizing transposase RayT